MRKKYLKNIEWSVLVCVILLIVIGLFAIYSATANSNFAEFRKQLIWIAISVPIAIVVACIDYELLVKISPFLYGASVISLIAVLFTESRFGATSWFRISDNISIQPSEFAKISIILFLAFVMSKIRQKGEKQINRPTRLGIVLLVFLLPLMLIIKQPDYGTAMGFVVALAFMLFIAGLDKKYIIAALVIVAISVPLLYTYVLPTHAKTRIKVFLNPDLDPRGDGYNINQSKIAIGAGGLTGMGYLKGNQTQLGFLHPKSTDFIFPVIAEERGFVVAALIIVLYVVLITKAINIAKTAKDDSGAFISAGVAGIFFFHMIENIGMTMGLLPITGVPLPFVSYGGSSLLSNFMMIALLINVSARRQKQIFLE